MYIIKLAFWFSCELAFVVSICGLESYTYKKELK